MEVTEAGTLMEVDSTILERVEKVEKVGVDEAQYQPPSDLEPGQVEATITELKPVKQSVTYDTSTGKMYAELGASTPCPAPASAASQPYFQSYQVLLLLTSSPLTPSPLRLLTPHPLTPRQPPPPLLGSSKKTGSGHRGFPSPSRLAAQLPIPPTSCASVC